MEFLFETLHSDVKMGQNTAVMLR